MSYRLKDIYIGDPDGLAEARKKNFTNYFYTKNINNFHPVSPNFSGQLCY